MNKKSIDILNMLSDEINQVYGFVEEKGSNYGEPAINSGPCGPFADIFRDLWDSIFHEKLSVVFVIDIERDECWHICLRLPSGDLFDGGIGVHDESTYNPEKYQLKEMVKYDKNLMEKHSYGLDREYPRFCPNFSKNEVKEIIQRHLLAIKKEL